MKVLVMGAGGVGGWYGGMLARRGHEVLFVARGAHLAALGDRGLTLRDGTGVHVLHPVRAVSSPAEAGPSVGLVLFTVKGQDTDPAALALAPAVGPGTVVLTLQNGVESVERLGAVLGAERVLAAATTIEVTVAEPGVVERRGPAPRIVLGEPAGAVTPRVEAVAETLRDTSAEIVVSPDIRRVLWEKFVRLAPGASLTAACQATIGEVRDTPEGAILYRALIGETVAVARAAGVLLPADAVEAAIRFIGSLPAAMKTSMQRDYERRGRVELEELTGAVVRLGRAWGVSTPTYDVVYGLLRVRALSFAGLGPRPAGPSTSPA